ncbi:MAG: hypothetical protein V2G41_09330 [bacterium JZ-2024 1]
MPDPFRPDYELPQDVYPDLLTVERRCSRFHLTAGDGEKTGVWEPITRDDADLVICPACPIKETKPKAEDTGPLAAWIEVVFEHYTMLKLRSELNIRPAPPDHYNPREWVCMREIHSAIIELEREEQEKAARRAEEAAERMTRGPRGGPWMN